MKKYGEDFIEREDFLNVVSDKLILLLSRVQGTKFEEDVEELKEMMQYYLETE